MAAVLKARREAAEAIAEAHSNIIELKKMHCDPAIAREVTLLKTENKKLQEEVSRLRGDHVANNFEVRTAVHALLMLQVWMSKSCTSR
jgi:hypothetical protein